MAGEDKADYLGGLPPAWAEELARVNSPGLTALHKHVASRGAVAFLGAGVSAPLYPLWDGLIKELVDAAAGALTAEEAATCRRLARESPEEVVEIVRSSLGTAAYREALRDVLRVRADPESGRSWTPVQELVCRCAFKAVVTTNYDPGIVDARIRVRPGASATGFTTWEDELGLDRWRTGDVFGLDELPVLFAHGQHNRPDSVVLAATEYRQAYAGKLPLVLARLLDGHLAWIGFSFADQRIAAILREIANRTGTRVSPGGPPRHVAVMAWDPDVTANDPKILARRAEIAYGAQVVLYPAPGGDHSALALLLADLVDERYPPAGSLPSWTTPPPPDPQAEDGPETAVRWVPAPEPVEHFTGRAEELARLDRWAGDPQVSLVGVSAWGGAGKTALVTHWVQEGGGLARRPDVRGVYAWSFYADTSAEHWAAGLLTWAQQQLGVKVPSTRRLAADVLHLLRTVPLLLILDGLEVAQEGPAGDGFGRLLDGTLREVLAGACQLEHAGLVLLTSRFPFADLETFDGASARILEVPPFTPAEGSDLLARAGGSWLPDSERRDLVRAVDGHALATGVLAGLLAARLPARELAALRAELAAATRTDTRVQRVLKFYSDRLSKPDRYLLAAISLFARPVPASAVLAIAQRPTFRTLLTRWTLAKAETAVRDRLSGLATWYPDGTISAHPLVRETFRPLAMGAADSAVNTTLTGVPTGRVTSRADGLRVVEAIELLLDAGQWLSANDLYSVRCDDGAVWQDLPAARLGQRAATAFVATPDRRAVCPVQLGRDRLSFYLNEVGLYAMNTGDLATARQYLILGNQAKSEDKDIPNLAVGLRNLAGCLGRLGQTDEARDAAAKSLGYALSTDSGRQLSHSRVYIGWVASLTGETAEAERQFTKANEIEIAGGQHLSSLAGVHWAEWLARTGRPSAAQRLTSLNHDISRSNGWAADVARCDRTLGRLATATGDIVAAGRHLMAAAACFREGDYLIELAITLVDLASWAQVSGDLDAADRYVTEAIAIAAPRELVPVQSAALAVRARIRSAQAEAAADPSLLLQGRDAADAALRLAARHHLAWHELDALRAHTALDRTEQSDHGWGARTDTLRARLLPPGLSQNPLRRAESVTTPQHLTPPDSQK
jgi:tetratricopeptide (TPR) repeat protein